MVKTLEGKRVAIIIPTLHIGGSERQAIHLACYLKEFEGSHVEVWGFDGPGLAASFIKAEGINYHLLPFKWWINKSQKVGCLLNFLRDMRAYKPNFLLPYTDLPNVVCGLTWRIIGVNSCLWSQRSGGLGIISKRIMTLAAKQTPRFVSNSHHAAEFLEKELCVPNQKIVVINNGILLTPARKSRYEWRERLGIQQDQLIACMIANLSPRKDHLTLLKAWRIVVDEMLSSGKQVTLLLAGLDQGMEDKVKALAFDLELGKSVQFLGEVEDITGLLEAVDLGVFSSQREGVPNGVLESMAAGLCIAATDIPGIREALGDHYPFLSEKNNASDLAIKILELIKSPDVCTKYGELNRHRVKIHFNPETMCAQTVKEIKRTLD
jgi:glycosyltransferase involved in cell wall biosynthesis